MTSLNHWYREWLHWITGTVNDFTESLVPWMTSLNHWYREWLHCITGSVNDFTESLVPWMTSLNHWYREWLHWITGTVNDFTRLCNANSWHRLRTAQPSGARVLFIKQMFYYFRLLQKDDLSDCVLKINLTILILNSCDAVGNDTLSEHYSHFCVYNWQAMKFKY